YRRAPLFHLADLDRRGVRPQQQRRGGLPVDEEGVLRVARRMVRWKVQRLEVVRVGLELGTVGGRIPHSEKDLFDSSANHGDGMKSPGARPPSRQRDVDHLRAVAALGLSPRELLGYVLDPLLDLLFDGIGARTERGPVSRSELLQA